MIVSVFGLLLKKECLLHHFYMIQYTLLMFLPWLFTCVCTLHRDWLILLPHCLTRLSVSCETNQVNGSHHSLGYTHCTSKSLKHQWMSYLVLWTSFRRVNFSRKLRELAKVIVVLFSPIFITKEAYSDEPKCPQEGFLNFWFFILWFSLVTCSWHENNFEVAVSCLTVIHPSQAIVFSNRFFYAKMFQWNTIPPISNDL